MAFGYNRTTGSATEVIGDLVAGSDPQRNTKILKNIIQEEYKIQEIKQ
jgi:hypothetical protein